MIDGNYKISSEYEELGLTHTVFHALLDSDLPPEEKLQSRLWQEGQVLIGAGADTTAQALTVTHFHILDNPEVLKKMRVELEKVMPNSYEPAELKVLEQLPYFVSSLTSSW